MNDVVLVAIMNFNQDSKDYGSLPIQYFNLTEQATLYKLFFIW